MNKNNIDKKLKIIEYNEELDKIDKILKLKLKNDYKFRNNRFYNNYYFIEDKLNNKIDILVNNILREEKYIYKYIDLLENRENINFAYSRFRKKEQKEKFEDKKYEIIEDELIELENYFKNYKKNIYEKRENFDINFIFDEERQLKRKREVLELLEDFDKEEINEFFKE